VKDVEKRIGFMAETGVKRMSVQARARDGRVTGKELEQVIYILCRLRCPSEAKIFKIC